jgi:hypothetical protein
MADMTLTDLRRRLFRVADRVLQTGTAVRIRRRGRVLTLGAEAGRAPEGRLSRLKRRRLIVGDPAKLWKVKAGEWRGPRDLG